MVLGPSIVAKIIGGGRGNWPVRRFPRVPLSPPPLPPPGTNPATYTARLSFCSILKFGVGISMDAKKLADGLGVQLIGCVDLQHIAVRSGIR